jgi:hypothetical protein
MVCEYNGHLVVSLLSQLQLVRLASIFIPVNRQSGRRPVAAKFPARVVVNYTPANRKREMSRKKVEMSRKKISPLRAYFYFIFFVYFSLFLCFLFKQHSAMLPSTD